MRLPTSLETWTVAPAEDPLVRELLAAAVAAAAPLTASDEIDELSPSGIDALLGFTNSSPLFDLSRLG